jgi:hypothetical protein
MARPAIEAFLPGSHLMAYRRFDESYDRYLLLRGYEPHWSKSQILKRALVDSWGEPGFHRFWRVWNPGIGHLLYHLYLAFGGNRKRTVATMLVFVLCGLMHDVLVMLIFRRPFAAFTIAFASSGILAVLNRSLEHRLRQDRWPRPLNALANLACLTISVSFAVQLQMHLFP